MKKVMVFGVFDGIHEGHLSLFDQAKEHGTYLLVVAAQDHMVEHLKSRLPERDVYARIEALKREPIVDRVVMGDDGIGAWGVLFEHMPEVIALGYDQAKLKKALEEDKERFHWKPVIMMMKAHEPEKYHSSLLRGKSKNR